MDEVKVVGHRGARGLGPENTLAAIEHALAAGVDEVEIDVRVTRDGMPVLHHNAVLRVNGRRFRVSRWSLEALRAQKPDLPTLAEALELIDTRCPVLVEVKPREHIEPIVVVLKLFLESKMYGPRDLLLASKNQKTLQALHRALPELPTVVIEPFSSVRARQRARQLGTKRLSMRHSFIHSGFVSAMHRRGYELYPYTLNDPRKAARWQQHGLAGVITDNPERFQK